MSRYAVKVLDYVPDEGQLAQALLDQHACLVDDEAVDVDPLQSMHFGTFLPAEDDPSTIVDEREPAARYFAALHPRTSAALPRLRPWHSTAAAIGTYIAIIGTRIAEDQHTPVARWRSPLSRIIREVGRLADGWAGEFSRAPSDGIVRTMQTLAGLLPAGAAEPSAEVDPDDGTVALTWTSNAKDESFTITIFSSGKVGGAHAALGKSALRAWIVPVQDYRKISAHLNQPRLLAIICG